MITLLVMTDGRRDCIARTIASALANLDGPITRRLIHDDSGDDEYQWWLRAAFPNFDVLSHPAGRQGFGGAIRNAWRHVRVAGERFVFHLEDDFVFRRPVNLVHLAQVLDDQPYLAQLAFRRQPWNDAERAAGGIVEQHPDDFTEISDPAGHAWLEHRRFFTTNPSLYRRDLCHRPWPDGSESEGRFTHELLTDPDVRFGYWGGRATGEWVTHIGDQRVGTGY